jgi:hypothetical protein
VIIGSHGYASWYQRLVVPRFAFGRRSHISSIKRDKQGRFGSRESVPRDTVRNLDLVSPTLPLA